MSKILSPNPLVITVTVNEITGQVQARCNREIPHISAVQFLLYAAQGFISDGMAMAARMQGGIVTPGGAAPPGGNPGGNPAGNPGGNTNAS